MYNIAVQWSLLQLTGAVMLDENAIISRLFTLGEIAQLCPGQTPSRVFMLVQSLIAAPTITSDGQFTTSSWQYDPLCTISSSNKICW